MRSLLWSAAMFTSAGLAGAADFQSPIRLKAGETPIGVESPGYAAPCWADIDEDGKPELLVGQFRGGKIRVFKQVGSQKFGDGKWLQAGGKDAEVPGVW